MRRNSKSWSWLVVMAAAISNPQPAQAEELRSGFEAQPSGTILFNTRIPGLVDARILLPDGSGPGAGFRAQLYGSPEGSTLIPLLPRTTFRTTSLSAQGYVNPVVVTVPGVRPGSRAIVEMRYYDGPTWQTSSHLGRSKAISVTLGGGLIPPAPLVGLEGFMLLPGPPVFAPWIVVEPAFKNLLAGDSVTLRVRPFEPHYNGPGRLHWLLDGRSLPGKTGDSLTIQDARLSDRGTYSVVIRYDDFRSSQSATARIRVNEPSVKGDLDQDGQPDLLFQNADGFLANWAMNGAALKAAAFLDPNRVPGPDWRAKGVGDFDRDGHQDLILQHSGGQIAFWFLQGLTRVSARTILVPGSDLSAWRLAAVADFNADGKADLVFQHEDGTLKVWLMDGAEFAGESHFDPAHPGDPRWRAVGSHDLNRDGRVDLVFQHEDGSLGVWTLDRTRLVQSKFIQPKTPGNPSWRVVAVLDLDRDGHGDLIFQHAKDLSLAVWFMEGDQLRTPQTLNPPQPAGTWRVQGP